MATETNPPLSKTVIAINIVGAVIAALSAIIDLEWVKANSVLFTSLGVILATLNALYPVLLRLTTTTLLKVVLLALGLGFSASPAAACAPGDIAISKAEGEEITRELQAKAQAERDLASIDVAYDCANCRAMRQPAILTPAQARWFRAMPLPWIERNVIRALFGR